MFQTLTGVLDPKKNPTDEEIKKIPSFIFCRWLSGHRATIGAANMFNLYSDIPIVSQYKMIKVAFGGKIKYIPYPKNTTIDTVKSIDFISTHFNISYDKAQEYLTLIDKEELKYIIQMYTDHAMRQ